MADVCVLGVDPGFASVGYAVLRLESEGETLLRLGVVRTEKAAAKRNVKASEDNVSRARELAEAFQGLLDAHDIRLICAETMSYPRNSASAAKMALCWGVLAAISQQRGIPIVQATPQEVKKAVTGKKDASKEEVMAAVRRVHPVLEAPAGKRPPLLADVAPSLWEHPYDAVASVVACRGSEVFMLARRMASTCAGSTASSSPAT